MLPLFLCALIAVAPGERLNVLDEGSGPAVLLVPGLSGAAYSYRHVTPALHEAGLRTLVVEPLAIGESDRPAGADYTLTAQARRLAAALDERGVRDVIAVAQGVSASMVLRLALERPDLVAAIVSVEGGAVESAATPGMRSGLRLARMVGHLGGNTLIRDQYADALREASGDDSWVDRRTVRKYFLGAMRDLDGTLAAFMAMSEQSEPVAITPRLPEIAVPVVLMMGGAEHHGRLESEEVATLRAGLPDLREVTIPGAGHFLMEEAPHRLVSVIVALSEAAASAAPSDGSGGPEAKETSPPPEGSDR